MFSQSEITKGNIQCFKSDFDSRKLAMIYKHRFALKDINW